jgi:hypothetical protein
MIWAFNVGLDPSNDEERKSRATQIYPVNHDDAYMNRSPSHFRALLIQTKSVDSVFKNVRSMFSLGSSTSESRAKSSGSSEGITGITVQTKMSQDSKGSHFEDV